MTTTTAPYGDLDGWRQLFVEDNLVDVPLGKFPSAVASRWAVYLDGWPDSQKHGQYWPSKVVSIANGILTKHIHTEGGIHMVAAIQPKFARMHYGRFAVRWRADKLPGYKLAWLLWPDNGDRMEGEVDWPEMNLDADRVGGFVHRPASGLPQGYVFEAIDTNVWNTCIIEWSPGLIVFILNGDEVYRVDKGVPTTGHHWVLQTETKMGEGVEPPADDVAGNVQIDWCAVWKYDTTAKAPPALRQLHVVAPASATGTVTVSANASDDVVQVKWMIDAVEVGGDATPPFTRQLDTTRFANGEHRIAVKGRGAWWFESPTQLITINNPVDVTVPATCIGTVALSIDHQYPWIKQVKWVVDDVEVGSDTLAPFQSKWDSTKLANGAHRIYAKINGMTWMNTATRTITVNN